MKNKTEIFECIKSIALKISNAIKFSELDYTNHQNSTGDTQLKLDVLSDEIITKEFSKLEFIHSLVSEEKEDELLVNKSGNLIIAYDPLDGSSLVDVNFSIGSIFGIYQDKISPKNLIASAYIIYGPRLEIVFCDDLPNLYRLDSSGEFKFVKELRLADKGKINATGGTQKDWSATHRNFINSLFDEGYRLRYSGAMVSDLHQILCKGGGIFSYPSTSSSVNGKLRVTFEILPFVRIFEKANGLSTDGKNSFYDLNITKIHQTSPCFFGSKYEIQKLIKDYADAK